MAKAQDRPRQNAGQYVWLGSGGLALRGEEGTVRLEPERPEDLTESQATRAAGLIADGRLVTVEAWKAKRSAKKETAEQPAPAKEKKGGATQKSGKGGVAPNLAGSAAPGGRAVIVAAGKVELPSTAGGKGKTSKKLDTDAGED